MIKELYTQQYNIIQTIISGHTVNGTIIRGYTVLFNV